MEFNERYTGTGSMQKFVGEVVKLFRAMNNITILMPTGYQGNEPTLEFQEGKLIFDMGETLVFTERGIEWNFSGDATINSNEAIVENGKLSLNVDASAYESINWFLEGTATYNSWSANVEDGVLTIIVDAD